MNADDPLNREQPFERFYLAPITENLDTTRKLFADVPESERSDVISPFERPNFSEALNDGGGLLISLSDGTPVGCLMSYPYEVALRNDAEGRTGNYYELGSIYVSPGFRQYELAELLVAFAIWRQCLSTPEVELNRFFAVSFPYQHPEQRAADPSIPKIRGGMAHILSADHLAFKPTTPPKALLEARETKGMINNLEKLWWFGDDRVGERSGMFLGRRRHRRLLNIYVLGKKKEKKAWLDTSAFRGLPAPPFVD